MEEELVNVARFLPEMARRSPESCAVKAPEGREPGGVIRYRECSFAELDGDTDAAARLLVSRGVERGTRALLMVKPGLDLIRICFALFKIGAVPVIIDPGMGYRNFLRCVRRSEPQALIAIREAHWLSRLFFPAFRSIRARVTVGSGSFVRALDSWRAKHADGEPFPVAATGADELAAILFTSGSTGPPKGVCYEHGMFEEQVRLIREAYGIEVGEVDLPMLPIFALFNPALGMTTVVPEMNPSRPAAVDPEKIVRAIRQCGVTNSFGSPVLWEKIGRYCEERGIVLPSLRRVLMAGAPVSPALIRRYQKILPNGAVHTPYGATEAMPVSSIGGNEILEHTSTLTEKGRGVCVGRALPGVDIKIIRIDDGPIENFEPGLECATGTVGEIIVKGPVVTRYYDKLKEATLLAKINDAGGEVRHRMGDLGYFDEEGRLWFCGRKVERVRTPSGELYTDCCEAVFNQHPDVFRSALIGLGPRDNQKPAIVIEPEKGKYPRGAARRKKFITELLALGSKHPHTEEIKTIYFHRSFPVDVRHNAKIHRLTLAKHFNSDCVL